MGLGLQIQSERLVLADRQNAGAFHLISVGNFENPAAY